MQAPAGTCTKNIDLGDGQKSEKTLEKNPENCSDAPEDQTFLRQLGLVKPPVYLLMDQAYEGDNMRVLASKLGYTPVVPPKSHHKTP